MTGRIGEYPLLGLWPSDAESLAGYAILLRVLRAAAAAIRYPAGRWSASSEGGGVMHNRVEADACVGYCRRCGGPLFDDESQGLVDVTGCCWCWVPGIHDVPRVGTGPHEVQQWRGAA